jgi:hypothetical protein
MNHKINLQRKLFSTNETEVLEVKNISEKVIQILQI